MLLFCIDFTIVLRWQVTINILSSVKLIHTVRPGLRLVGSNFPKLLIEEPAKKM